MQLLEKAITLGVGLGGRTKTRSTVKIIGESSPSVSRVSGCFPALSFESCNPLSPPLLLASSGERYNIGCGDIRVLGQGPLFSGIAAGERGPKFYLNYVTVSVVFSSSE